MIDHAPSAIAPGEYESLRHRVHPHCFVCGPNNPLGLGVPFALTDDGTLCGTFDCPPAFEGYPGQLQGGVVAALLDGAMANWLFANHIVAVTAELTTRFRHPVRTHQPAEIRAQIVRADRGLYLLKATLSQEGQCRADARGKFLVPPPNKTPSHGKPNGVS